VLHWNRRNYGGTHMSKRTSAYPTAQPMRIQARKGSLAEKRYYYKSSLPGGAWPMPKAIADGVDPSPLDDLMFHGGQLKPQMQYQNIFLGSQTDWVQSDIDNINSGIKRAMQDKRLNNVIRQYFGNSAVACDPRTPLLLSDAKPKRLDEPDVQAKVVSLFDSGKITKTDLGVTLFNLVLPRGTVLSLGGSSSLNGLGGYHGSLHINRNGKSITLYYSANVFSEFLSSGKENGIVAFDKNWKNVVGTLYHELNEFRTDPDVNDAIKTGNNDFLGWTSRRGHECGDQPIFVASSLDIVFREVLSGGKKTPVQFMFSNAVHGAEGPIAAPHA
jgi:hypothetical protein